MDGEFIDDESIDEMPSPDNGGISDTGRISDTGSVSNDSAAATEAAVESVEADIAALSAERDQFKDIALRLQADFENYRKRVTNSQADEVDRSTGRLAEAILPVLDACEAAFGHGVTGVEPIWSALIGTLQKHGLEAMDLQDKPFDPSDADAVAHDAGDGDGGSDGPIVVEVMRTGYRWKGRVLRPAMVRVKG